MGKGKTFSVGALMGAGLSLPALHAQQYVLPPIVDHLGRFDALSPILPERPRVLRLVRCPVGLKLAPQSA